MSDDPRNSDRERITQTPKPKGTRGRIALPGVDLLDRHSIKCAQVGGSEFALFAEFRRDRPEFPPEVKQKRALMPIGAVIAETTVVANAQPNHLMKVWLSRNFVFYDPLLEFTRLRKEPLTRCGYAS
ncbi:MAG: hypothetical protein Rhirs2KO_04980 [Rhizobiaceae bacterium]